MPRVLQNIPKLLEVWLTHALWLTIPLHLSQVKKQIKPLPSLERRL
jgi:hypothetical protein